MVLINGINLSGVWGWTDAAGYGNGSQSGEFIIPVHKNDEIKIWGPYISRIYFISFK